MESTQDTHIIEHHFFITLPDGSFDIMIVYDLPLYLAEKFVIKNFPLLKIEFLESISHNNP